MQWFLHKAVSYQCISEVMGSVLSEKVTFFVDFNVRLNQI